jgi:hypothetical protein
MNTLGVRIIASPLPLAARLIQGLASDDERRNGK